MPKYPDAALVLTGLVTPEFERFKAGLEARIAEAGLQGRILFIGERPSEEMPAWFRRVALYVAPMRNEGFGLTPLEAMASGAAVVATRAGAASVLVADGETGLHCRARRSRSARRGDRAADRRPRSRGGDGTPRPPEGGRRSRHRERSADASMRSIADFGRRPEPREDLSRGRAPCIRRYRASTRTR